MRVSSSLFGDFDLVDLECFFQNCVFRGSWLRCALRSAFLKDQITDPGVGGEGPARSHIPKDRVTVPGREVNRVYHSRQRNWERSFYLPTSSHIADSPERDVTLDILRDSAQNALNQTKKYLAAILTLFPPVWKKRERKKERKKRKKKDGRKEQAIPLLEKNVKISSTQSRLKLNVYVLAIM